MKKEELKEILKPVIKEICMQMHDELSYEERQLLALEFSVILISTTINFAQDIDSFNDELVAIINAFAIQGGAQIIKHKADFDKGKSIGEPL